MAASLQALAVFVCVCGVLLAQPSHSTRTLRPRQVVYVVHGPTNSSSNSTNATKALQEAGFNGGFSMPSFADFISVDAIPDSLSRGPTEQTVYPSSSLTGLPWAMTFQQQMSGGLPVVQWPPRPSSGGTQSTVDTPAQEPQPATSQPTPTPAPAPASAPAPAPASTACSPSDTSPSAVHACVNAMRTDPQAWTEHYKCNWQSWLSAFTGQRRGALRTDNRLARSASKLAPDMAGTRTVSHVGSDGSTMAQRIGEAGFTTYPQAENVAGGQNSALQVAADWMCSEGHRNNIMSCSVDTVGTATSYDVDGRPYFVQDFGCSVTNSCAC